MHVKYNCIRSGQYGSHGCDRSFDNNIDSWWSSWAAGYESSTWIGMDFRSAPKDIVHVRLMVGRPAGANQNVVIEWSDDKSNWTEWDGNRIFTSTQNQTQDPSSRTNTWDEAAVP